jgi:hypothetical protein
MYVYLIHYLCMYVRMYVHINIGSVRVRRVDWFGCMLCVCMPTLPVVFMLLIDPDD